MIFGVGTDLVEIKRIHEMKSYESFAIKILSEEAVSYTHLRAHET